MSDCFPPVPLYIVTGIITAMFTNVASKIEIREGEQPKKGDTAFAAFLLVILAIPFVQLLLIILTNIFSGQCGASPLNVDGRWLLSFHALTIAPLLVGAVYWFWNRSGSMGCRLAFSPSQGSLS